MIDAIQSEHAVHAEQALARASRAREFEDFRLTESLIREAHVHALLALAESQQPVKVEVTQPGRWS